MAELVETRNQTNTYVLTLSSRSKTPGTIIEKIRRGTRLSTMQDVFGFRISASSPPGGFTLANQDDVVGEIVRRFSRSKTIDRRSRPSSGYRAVHIVVSTDGFPIEIQVRTYLQDLWANETEALADLWGRGIRYGLPPEGRTQEEATARAAVVTVNEVVSDRMYDWERAVVELPARVGRELLELGLGTDEQIQAEMIARIRGRMDPVQEALISALREFRQRLSTAAGT